MKPHIKLEREVYFAWRKRHLIKDELAFSKAKFKKSSEKELVRKLKEAQILTFGDDRLVPADQERIVRILKKVRINADKTVFVTNRTKIPKLLALWLQKKRILVRRVADDDRKIARRTQKLLSKGKRVIVWTGALRLAPNHLPIEMAKIATKKHYTLFHAPLLRFKSGAESDWLSIGADCTSWVGSSSLIALEYRRCWNERIDNPLSPTELKLKFQTYSDKIASLMKQPKPKRPKAILTAFNLDEWPRHPPPFLVDRLKRGESAVMPKEKIVLLSSLEPGHVAEEAGHDLRLSNVSDFPTDERSVAIEEAFGFFASLLIDPKRKIPQTQDPSLWAQVHIAGYKGGNHLYQRWCESAAAKKEIRKIWRVHLTRLTKFPA